MTASEQIDKQIEKLNDWRGKRLASLRQLIRGADSAIAEDWKWNTAVFTKNGNLCALGAFKDHIKINFFKGASLPDPQGLFNAGLDAKTSRAIDIYEDDRVNQQALKNLVNAAVSLNSDGSKKSVSATRKEPTQQKSIRTKRKGA